MSSLLIFLIVAQLLTVFIGFATAHLILMPRLLRAEDDVMRYESYFTKHSDTIPPLPPKIPTNHHPYGTF